jgi:hypothetical protein
MKKLALATAVGAIALFVNVDAKAAPLIVQAGVTPVTTTTNALITDVRWRRPHRVYRRYGYRPLYRSYAYAPAPYYPAPYYGGPAYGYGGPVVSFGFGGGGWGHGRRW